MASFDKTGRNEGNSVEFSVFVKEPKSTPSENFMSFPILFCDYADLVVHLLGVVQEALVRKHLSEHLHKIPRFPYSFQAVKKKIKDNAVKGRFFDLPDVKRIRAICKSQDFLKIEKERWDYLSYTAGYYLCRMCRDDILNPMMELEDISRRSYEDNIFQASKRIAYTVLADPDFDE